MKHLILFAFLIYFISSCKPDSREENSTISIEKEMMESLLDVNKTIVKRSRNHIENFIKRTGWGLEETVDGIWFGLIDSQEGEKASLNDQVEYVWQLQFMDGSYYKNSQTKTTSVNTIGQGGIESGLEKGLLLMHVGDRARIIVPPYLAHGNFGDIGDIPPGAIHIFHVKLLKISRNS